MIVIIIINIMKIKRFFCLGFIPLIFGSFALHAKDYGIKGEVFTIEEKNILEVIQSSLTPEVVKDFNDKFKAEAKKSINRPKGINLPVASKFRKFIYDPSIILKNNLKDHKGQIFAIKGQKVNPLDHVSLNETLIFIDGDNKDQVKFALNFQKPKKIILTTGEPIRLSQQNEAFFYFDFDAMMSKKFKIRALPAIVYQKNKVLEINEVAL